MYLKIYCGTNRIGFDDILTEKSCLTPNILTRHDNRIMAIDAAGKPFSAEVDTVL